MCAVEDMWLYNRYFHGFSSNELAFIIPPLGAQLGKHKAQTTLSLKTPELLSLSGSSNLLHLDYR